MITTKKGDSGQTDCGSKRVNKDDLLVETIGQVDELQAVLELIGIDKGIIRDLGMIMGELGSNKKCLISNVEFLIKAMEEEIGKNNKKLSKFIIFETKKAKELTWARTVCRRVERRVVALSKIQKLDDNILRYFNRLSDYLFILALKEI